MKLSYYATPKNPKVFWSIIATIIGFSVLLAIVAVVLGEHYAAHS